MTKDRMTKDRYLDPLWSIAKKKGLFCSSYMHLAFLGNTSTALVQCNQYKHHTCSPPSSENLPIDNLAFNNLCNLTLPQKRPHKSNARVLLFSLLPELLDGGCSHAPPVGFSGAWRARPGGEGCHSRRWSICFAEWPPAQSASPCGPPPHPHAPSAAGSGSAAHLSAHSTSSAPLKPSNPIEARFKSSQ